MKPRQQALVLSRRFLLFAIHLKKESLNHGGLMEEAETIKLDELFGPENSPLVYDTIEHPLSLVAGLREDLHIVLIDLQLLTVRIEDILEALS